MGFNVDSVEVNFRKKMFKALLDIIALRYLRDNESLALHDFLTWLREKCGVLLSSGTVYGRIYSMERSGLVRRESGEKKRVYLLTEKGEAALKSLLSDTPAEQFLTLLEPT